MALRAPAGGFGALIHVATVHHRSAAWIGVQLDYLERHTREPYRVWACLNGIAPEHGARFDVVVESGDPSPGQSFNAVASAICERARAEDLLVFLHGDSFPIADWVEPARKMLEGAPLASVRRDENLEEPQPHNCFTVTTAGLWRQIGGDWSPGPTWTIRTGEQVTDAGAVLWKRLEELGIHWHPILRSNTRDLHPLWFAVYGHVVYHHGAAFRKPMSRVDAATAPPKRGLNRIRRFVQLERRARRMRVLGEEIYDRLSRDEDFYRELVA